MISLTDTKKMVVEKRREKKREEKILKNEVHLKDILNRDGKQINKISLIVML